MQYTLYMRTLLFAVLALSASACGQKGPLVAPPGDPAIEAQTVPGDMPADDMTIEEIHD